MKKQNTLLVIALATAFLVTITGCRFASGGASDFSSDADKFSIAFPAGSADVETKTASVKYAKSGRTYSKSVDNKTPDFKSYGVEVLDIKPSQTAGKSDREIMEIALNGWEKEKDTQIKEVTAQGQKGIDSLRSMEIGPAKMTFREVVFYSAAKMKLYVVKVSATKKENTQTKEAEEFINSFNLKS